MILPCFNLITKPFDEQAKKLEPFKWADPEIGKRNKIGGIPDGIKEEDFHGLLVNIYENHLKDSLTKEETSEEKKEETIKIDVTTDDYKKTTDKENCTTSLPMYLDHDNHLNVIVNEYKDGIVNKQIYNLNAKKVVER